MCIYGTEVVWDMYLNTQQAPMRSSVRDPQEAKSATSSFEVVVAKPLARKLRHEMDEVSAEAVSLSVQSA